MTGLQQLIGSLSIRYKLLAIAMITATLSLLILAAAFIFYHTYVARTSLQRELTAAAEIIGRNSTAALLFGDRKAAEETLEALRARPDIIGASIENAQGEVFARIGSAAPASPGGTMTVAVPVENNGERIGRIRLWSSLDRLTEEQSTFWMFAALAAIVAVLAGFALSTLLRPIIMRPLDLLAGAMADVSRNRDYGVRVPTTTRDELGIVVDGFNFMLAEIERQHRELEHYRTTLEAQVEERTAALSESNEQLKRTIEEVHAARLQAEAASQAKSEFLANMSHELRTPLNAIIGFSDLMKSEILGPIQNTTYAGYVGDIHFSGKHLLDVINDILDVARHESGKMDLHEDVLPVEQIVDEALRVVSPQALRAQVALIWSPPVPALPPLRCDRVRVRQMLLNILSNAIKFTEPGGTVEVKGELGAGVELTVRDTGIGIDPGDISRIMTPFGQIAPVYTRNHQGTGLGLVLTKALIERHGGRLTLYSAPGVGTTVRLSFPAERTTPTERADELLPAAERSASG
jgi:signal transduction histidine kinase